MNSASHLLLSAQHRGRNVGKEIENVQLALNVVSEGHKFTWLSCGFFANQLHKQDRFL